MTLILCFKIQKNVVEKLKIALEKSWNRLDVAKDNLQKVIFAQEDVSRVSIVEGKQNIPPNNQFAAFLVQ